MDQLTALKLFTRIIDVGTISGAGQTMGMSSTASSKAIQDLEATLGVRLLNRSTRQVAVTEAGQHLFQRIGGLLGDLDKALQEAGALQDEPVGQLRVTARRSFALTHILPALPRFRTTYPRLDVALTLTEVLDITPNEEADLVIRLGMPSQKSFIAHELASSERLLCASPAYLNRKGMPSDPQSLAAHDCLCYRQGYEPALWLFETPDGTIEVPVSGPLVSNSGEALLAAAREGLGLVVLPRWLLSGDIQRGALVHCLPALPVHPAGYNAATYAVHARGDFVPTKVTVFIDYLIDRMKSSVAASAALD